jgi:single-strand DNA-binding protein
VNETTLTIVGRVVNKPEYKQTANDVEVAKFRMASNARRFDKASGTWVDADTLYVNVTCWRRLAFGVHACLDKGDPVVVTGRLYTREFELDGKRRFMTELEATSIGPDLTRCTVKVHRRRDNQQADLDATTDAATDAAATDAATTDGSTDADVAAGGVADDRTPAVAAA